MPTQWFYRTPAGKEEGPVSKQQLQSLADVGLIGPTTEIKKRPDGRWVAANKVQGLLDEAKWFYRNGDGDEVGPMTARQLQTLAEVGLIGPNTEIKKRAGGRWVVANKVRGLLDDLDASSPIEEPAPAPPQQAAGDQRAVPATPAVPPPAPNGATGARASGTGERPQVPLWGPSFYPWEEPPAKPRSRLPLIVSGCVAALLVIAFLAGAFDTGTAGPVPDGPGDGTGPHAVESANRRTEAPELEPNKLFSEAKRVLLARLSDVGGTPEANVNAGIELLTKYLARPDATDRTEAALLLEHARTAVSDDTAVQLLLAVGDAERSELAGTSSGFGRADLVLLPKSRVEALSPGFCTRLKTQFTEEGRASQVFVTSQSYRGGGRDHNSIETAFYETLKKNAARATRQADIQRIVDRGEKAKRRDEKERQAVLQNGTDEFKRIVEEPDKYMYGHYTFDGVFGSPLGNLRPQKEPKGYSIAFRCRDTPVAAVARPVKDRLTFVVSDSLGTKLLDLKDGESHARVYCRIRYGDPDTDAFPQAVVYKIDFYADATHQGAPKFTVE
ncbi:GYF domain-containing protein [Frigoriglobus tundricola]|uniref:Uncharacterized protein n=1 Tax=Frigoriglobus tundricola TaxID=2774151 RepID=A0A6M5YN40_9BACT|nr:GYF domain-containing protein [Frigoriglobus tundricola]QJW94756.1 hypothetical protein FTUN_2279 [Frigoriglobus tundricola]